MRGLILFLCILTCAFAAATTKVGGSGTTKVGGSGTTKVQPVVSGTPTGNVFTHVATSGIGAAGITVPSGNVGDIVVIFTKWENTGTISTFVSDTGESFTMTSASDNAGSSGEPHVIGGFMVRTSTSACSVTRTSAGSLTFPATWYKIYRATGTISLDTQAAGNITTGTTVTSGAFTTGTVNGVTCVAIAGYTGGVTYSSLTIGGNAGTNANLTDSSDCFDYINTAQLSSATAAGTGSTSNRYTLKALSLKAL